MRLKIFLLFFFSFIILFGFSFTKFAIASTFTLSGNVQDSSGNAISGATIDVYNPGTTTDVVPSITTDQSGNYSFSSVPQGTYDIKVTPSTGNFSSSIVKYPFHEDKFLRELA